MAPTLPSPHRLLPQTQSSHRLLSLLFCGLRSCFRGEGKHGLGSQAETTNRFRKTPSEEKERAWPSAQKSLFRAFHSPPPPKTISSPGTLANPAASLVLCTTPAGISTSQTNRVRLATLRSEAQDKKNREKHILSRGAIGAVDPGPNDVACDGVERWPSSGDTS